MKIQGSWGSAVGDEAGRYFNYVEMCWAQSRMTREVPGTQNLRRHLLSGSDKYRVSTWLWSSSRRLISEPPV